MSLDRQGKGRRWAGRGLIVLAALALLAALWPNARSLYELTGEEALRGQVAGVFKMCIRDSVSSVTGSLKATVSPL